MIIAYTFKCGLYMRRGAFLLALKRHEPKARPKKRNPSRMGSFDLRHPGLGSLELYQVNNSKPIFLELVNRLWGQNGNPFTL